MGGIEYFCGNVSFGHLVFGNGDGMTLPEYLASVRERCESAKMSPKVQWSTEGFNQTNDISKLLEIIEVLSMALKEQIDFQNMNQYPDHEVRHTLCVAVPDISQQALAKAESIAKGATPKGEG